MILAGCGGSGAAAVAGPVPPAAQATGCATLVRTLPPTLAGAHRRRTDPASPYTAAYGSPAITLRCGVAVPPHDPAAYVEQVNGVDWLPVAVGSGARYVSWTARLVVEITVPPAYRPADVLLALPARTILGG